MPRRQLIGCLVFGAVLLAMGGWTLLLGDLDRESWRGVPMRYVAPASIVMGLVFLGFAAFRRKPL